MDTRSIDTDMTSVYSDGDDHDLFDRKCRTLVQSTSSLALTTATSLHPDEDASMAKEELEKQLVLKRREPVMTSTIFYVGGDIAEGALKTEDGSVLFGFSSVYNKRGHPESSTCWGLNPGRKERFRIGGVGWQGPHANTISYLRKNMDLDNFLTPGDSYVCYMRPPPCLTHTQHQIWPVHGCRVPVVLGGALGRHAISE
jgi:hypothetical protein